MNALLKSADIETLKGSMEEAIASGYLHKIEFPLRHFFADGLYGREITVPAGGTVVTKVHKKEHITFALSGTAVVVDENGIKKEIIAPAVFITPPGTQRAVYAKTEVIWATVHSNEQKLETVEDIENSVTCDTMQEYNRLLEAL